MKKLRKNACVSFQSRCSACLMLRSYVIFRISSVLSAGPLGDEGWWGLVVMVGNTCYRQTGSFISTSLSLTRIRPSLYVRRAVMPQFAAQLLCAPPPSSPCYVTCHPYHKDPSQTQVLTHTNTHRTHIQSTTAGMRSDCCCECVQQRAL